MPALPDHWAHDPDPAATYVAMASRLPLTRKSAIPAFLFASLKVGKQLRVADGLVMYGLNASFRDGVFETFSVWRDREALDAMAARGRHREAARRFQPILGNQNFAFVDVGGDEIPRTWPERTAVLD